MTSDRKLMQQALEALVLAQKDAQIAEADYAIAALRERLAQPEQEPVAWISKHGVVYPLDAKDEVHPINDIQPLYTTPPRREWVGLTDDELEMLELKHAPPVHPEFVKDDDWWEFARAIEAKLKEKNA